MIKNKNELTLGSLFDGSGGFPLAGILAGVTPLWASEIEPFAVRVTTARLPQMRRYGDVSGMSGADLPPVDIITFGGTPGYVYRREKGRSGRLTFQPVL